MSEIGETLQEIEDFTSTFDDMYKYMRNDLMSELLIPGVTRPSLVQLEKHIVRMPRTSPSTDDMKVLVSAGILLGELIKNAIPEATWNLKATELFSIKIQIVDEETKEPFNFLPVWRVIQFFQTKDSSHGIVRYYDNVLKSIKKPEIL